MVDAGQEAYARWAHGVVVRQKELEVEFAAWYVISALSLFRGYWRNSEYAYLRSSSRRGHLPKRRSSVRSRRVVVLRCPGQAHFVTSPFP